MLIGRLYELFKIDNFENIISILKSLLVKSNKDNIPSFYDIQKLVGIEDDYQTDLIFTLFNLVLFFKIFKNKSDNECIVMFDKVLYYYESDIDKYNVIEEFNDNVVNLLQLEIIK